jgi:hypothetical protein
MSFALPATMEGGKMSVVRGRLERMDVAGCGKNILRVGNKKWQLCTKAGGGEDWRE